MMHGRPSSIDTFDPKPRLDRDNGKPIPFKRGLTFGETSVGGPMKPLWPYKQYGQSGLPVSDLFPHAGSCADELCVILSMVGDGVNHGAGDASIAAGVFQLKRPSMGSLTLYGLGTENQDLPLHRDSIHEDQVRKETSARCGGKNEAKFRPDILEINTDGRRSDVVTVGRVVKSRAVRRAPSVSERTESRATTATRKRNQMVMG